MGFLKCDFSKPILRKIGPFQFCCSDLFTNVQGQPQKLKYKDCPIKKETNLEAYISVNFLHILTNSAPQIMQIFPAFHRDAL